MVLWFEDSATIDLRNMCFARTRGDLKLPKRAAWMGDSQQVMKEAAALTTARKTYLDCDSPHSVAY
jgi:hypothetical protein